jgi:general secretion pathway protein H
LTNSAPRAVRGFTLIEILVVVLIIGIMITGAALSIGVAGGDKDLNKERDRIVALTDYLREQAALQNREYGMRCYVGGYEFLVYDARAAQWQRLQDDTLTRPRALPAGLGLELSVEGRRVVLPPADEDAKDLAPQIMLFSSGDMNLFELILRRNDAATGVRFAPSASADRIEISVLAPSAA